MPCVSAGTYCAGNDPSIPLQTVPRTDNDGRVTSCQTAPQADAQNSLEAEVHVGDLAAMTDFGKSVMCERERDPAPNGAASQAQGNLEIPG